MTFEATAFGLDLCADRPLSYLAGAEGTRSGRRLELALVERPDQLGWPDGAELISDQRNADGSVNFQIEAAEGAGHRIWGPRYGASVISADGGSVRGAPGTGGMRSWQRMLVAQVLPFVAVLRGLEVFHASAVALGDHAAAFIAPSGMGKTSLAVALSERGAGFLADDVLAVERVGEELIGHPGAPMVGIDRGEAERVVPMPRLGAPAPLRSVFFLDRREDGPDDARFEPRADARELLAATFNLVLAEPRRLEGLLDICAEAARGCVERIRFGPSVDASRLALAVEQRVGAPR